MSFYGYGWGPKPTVAQQRKEAEAKLAQMRKKGARLDPVIVEGTKIASSFWGKSWCSNLEHYSDYANRLPRGRSYVRHRAVIDLNIAKGEVTAQVNGSSLYKVRITIAQLAAKAWTGICGDCSGSIDTMVELLQGRMDKAVMDRVCRTGDGLFPGPKEIKLSCSCPDGAYMCKHVAATLYGVGARLDSRPELLFVLRGVDQQDLIAGAAAAPAATVGKTAAKSKKVLVNTDLASVFGLDMADPSEQTGSGVAKVTSSAAVKSKPAKSAQKAPAATNRSSKAALPPVKAGKAAALSARSPRAQVAPSKRPSAPSGGKSTANSSSQRNHKATSIT